MKVLVTGATGFIGNRLIHFLLQKNLHVRALCRKTSNTKVLSDLPVDIVWGDIRDITSVKNAVEGCDYVFHLAGYAKNWAKDTQTFYDINTLGVKNILIASQDAKIKRIILASTSMVFGPSKNSEQQENEQDSKDFHCEYQRSKYEAEKAVTSFVQQGLSVMLVHPTRVFGPGLLTEGNSMTQMIQLYLKGKFRMILSDGSAIGNYVFIDDVVQGLWLAAEKGRPGEQYILGGENLSYTDFFETLKDVSNCSRSMFHLPPWMAMGFSYLQSFLANVFGKHPLITPEWTRIFLMDWAFSSQKAEEELGYIITPIRTGLKKTVDWIYAGQPQPLG